MPEGDTVFRAARRLDAALTGKTLTGCDIRVPRYATVNLTGKTVDETVSRGKHLLTRIDKVSIHTHLKMEGVWHVYEPGQRWRRPGFTARIILSTDSAVAVGFSLGKVEVLPRTGESKVVGHLGPDLLGPDWDAEEAVRRLKQDPLRPIGIALLDQRNLAGIGNVFRSEACFLAGVDPRVPVGEVADLPALVETARTILTDGAYNPPRREVVYGRSNRPCPRCGHGIRSGILGDGTDPERKIYFCPNCLSN
ncbi:Fpg/Nei family DNA glycosylase [Antrihabitans sp. YC2-6]|uniref:Fpg/Nei family DNA glycosylase n=1 Tax=Antrihabitans sp. YC2-6 TaxID=2799498 RepID=UPI0018F66397|nr:Fpg/Nei family DNA glycosylase [Antrihabitans sp. YC2-6]MBJ8347357.1 Fpg/Nei family DNA glycosylase [Antrihabitans sp. YC2-6]